MLKDVYGNVLEVGVGTGANLVYYSDGVNVIGNDFSPKMLKKAYSQANRARANIALGVMDVQHLGFPDNTFNFVISSLVFCTVPYPVRGLKEIRCVVKPNGQIMLEHMRSHNEVVGKVLDFFNPVTLKLFGENINRRTVENIVQAVLKVEKEECVLTSVVKELK